MIYICKIKLLSKFVLDKSGEFKVIHFISSNLLHDFPNCKYMLFSLKYIYIYVKKGSTRLNPQPDWLEPIFNPLKMTHFLPKPNLQPDWPDPNQPNPPVCHVHTHTRTHIFHLRKLNEYLKGTSLKNICRNFYEERKKK